MGCSCKNKIAMEEKYGTIVESGPIERFLNLLIRIFIFLIVVSLTIILVPIVLIVVIYNIFFGKNKGISVPKRILDTLKNFEKNE